MPVSTKARPWRRNLILQRPTEQRPRSAFPRTVIPDLILLNVIPDLILLNVIPDLILLNVIPDLIRDPWFLGSSPRMTN